MASVSSLAVWFSQNSGQVNVIWMGWEINTSLSIFILAAFIFFFTLLILFLGLRKLILFPVNFKNKIKNYNIKKAENALQEGLLASVYDEKDKVLKSYNKVNKYLKEKPIIFSIKASKLLNKRK